MSKLIDSLNRIQTTMTEKSVVETPPKRIWESQESLAEQPAAVASSPVAAPEPGKFSLSPQAFYSVFAAVMVIVVLSLILSYRAFNLISERNSDVVKLANAITKQSEKIKSLENTIVQLSAQQSQQLAEIKESVGSLEQLINKSAKGLAEMALNQAILGDTVKDLKTENRDLKNNYKYLSGEFSRVKQLLTKMVEETAADLPK